jgi:twitching motility protein PilT
MSARLADLQIEELLRFARRRSASDIHFGGTERPAVRIDGRLLTTDVPVIAPDAIRRYLETVLAPAARDRLESAGTADGAGRSADIGCYRIHAYRHVNGTRVVIRLLSERIPQLETLELPPVIGSFANRTSGLVLFTGPTGSGKTTALAAVIDRINRTSERNIITVEDPIEFIHTSQRALITHCEIGRDVAGYAEALRGALRADPDVLLIGEMRDPETMATALTAAETGHLVLATLHTNDTAQTVDRLLDAFPGERQNQIRSQLANVLIAVVGLRLVPRSTGTGRRAAVEVLVATDAVRALIRDAKTHQLRNAIVTGRNAGMQTLESHLSELVMRGEIAYESACAAANRPADIRNVQPVASA